MRIMVFFDLPTDTVQDRRAYRLFRKYLISEGFIMMQESVYTKLALNEHVAQSVIQNLKQHRPENGLVQALRVTERQFADMVYIAGSKYESAELDSFDTLVII